MAFEHGAAAVNELTFQLLSRQNTCVLRSHRVMETGRQEGIIRSPGVKDGGVRSARGENFIGPVLPALWRERRCEPSLLAGFPQPADADCERVHAHEARFIQPHTAEIGTAQAVGFIGTAEEISAPVRNLTEGGALL